MLDLTISMRRSLSPRVFNLRGFRPLEGNSWHKRGSRIHGCPARFGDGSSLRSGERCRDEAVEGSSAALDGRFRPGLGTYVRFWILGRFWVFCRQNGRRRVAGRDTWVRVRSGRSARAYEGPFVPDRGFPASSIAEAPVASPFLRALSARKQPRR